MLHRKRLAFLLPALLSATCAVAGEPGAPSPAPRGSEPALRQGAAVGRHLRPEDRLGVLLDHPAFAGHSRLLLPWDGRDYDRDMPLARIGSLLPYHSHVVPSVVVAGLNRMVDDVSAGRTVFLDFHTAQQKRADPAKAHTGLFFFRGRPGAPFAVIAPGGGFSYVGSVHEGFPYALEINRRGFNAFVLKYRAGLGGQAATEDLAAAVSYLLRHAAELDIAATGYSLWGSSAGARMAAAIGSHGLRAFGGDDGPKPAAVVMAYTGHSDHAAVEPPTYVVVGEQDGIAPPAVMERRVAALRAQGTRVAYQRVAGVGHGFGTGEGTRAQGWIDQAARFWEDALR